MNLFNPGHEDHFYFDTPLPLISTILARSDIIQERLLPCFICLLLSPTQRHLSVFLFLDLIASNEISLGFKSAFKIMFSSIYVKSSSIKVIIE